MTRNRLVFFALAPVAIGLVAGLPASGDTVTIHDFGVVFPDGSVQTTAAAADPRRAFYLTDTLFWGDQVLTACTSGFHTASLFEILDVSNLRYATEVTSAAYLDDSGAGPPSGIWGWIRTGSSADVSLNPGQANCNGWTSSSGLEYGTQVGLAIDWSSTSTALGWLGPWLATTDCCGSLPGLCNFGEPVWCIAD